MERGSETPAIPNTVAANHTMLDGLSLMGWLATVSSRATVTPVLGKGSVYMWTYTSDDGDWSTGPRATGCACREAFPAANFWLIVIYDVWTRSMLANGQMEASKNSYDPELPISDDGSVESSSFAPEPPGTATRPGFAPFQVRDGSRFCGYTDRSRDTWTGPGSRGHRAVDHKRHVGFSETEAARR